MSTSGSFNPPENPCPANAFTATEIVALRDSGQLRPECHYIVNGPTIGTPGSTSPTVIELHAVTPSTLSKDAKVFQSFNPEGAFVGNYDPDADTANGGSLNALTDHWGNDVTDEDAGAPTVHTQFPWHLAGPDVRDNIIDDCILTGWAGVSGQIRDNNLKGSTVDLTGRTGPTSRFNSNTIVDGLIALNVPTSFFDNNQITSAQINHLGTGAGSFSFQNNVLLTGDVEVDATTTAQVTMNNNVFGGTAGGYRVAVTGKTGSSATVSGNRLFNVGGATQDLLIGGPAIVSVTGNQIGAGDMRLTGAGDATVRGCNLAGATVTHQGSGVFLVDGSTVQGSSIITAAPSTRGLTVNSGLVNSSTVTQNGTGSANADRFPTGSATVLQRATVTFHATSAATPVSAYSGLVATAGASVDVADHTAATPLNNVRVEGNTVLNLSAAAAVSDSRFACGAVVNVGHAVTSCIVEGLFTKTTTGANVNTLTNASFDSFG